LGVQRNPARPVRRVELLPVVGGEFAAALVAVRIDAKRRDGLSRSTLARLTEGQLRDIRNAADRLLAGRSGQ
jgi:hypothetical protein